jgi:hypothetical protein
MSDTLFGSLEYLDRTRLARLATAAPQSYLRSASIPGCAAHFTATCAPALRLPSILTLALCLDLSLGISVLKRD